MPTGTEHREDAPVRVGLGLAGFRDGVWQGPAMRFGQVDVAHGFMAGWTARFHGTGQRCYMPLAVNRVESSHAKKPQRLLYEVAHCLRGGYLLLTWNIDEMSVRWLDFSEEKAARTAMAQLVL